MKYYVLDNQEPEDAVEIPDPGSRVANSHTAERAAEHYNAHGGWEASWPLTIVLLDKVGGESRWKVDWEMVQEFCATQLKEETQ